MKRQTLVFAALAATLAATAYLALVPDTDTPGVAVAIALPRAAGGLSDVRSEFRSDVRAGARPDIRPDARPAGVVQAPSQRSGWTVLTPAALAAWAPPPPARRPFVAPPASPAEAAAEAPKPKPPPFPYRWIGSLEQNGASTALLDGPQRSLGAQAGQVLDGQWRVERITGDRIELIWLPTGDVVALDKR